MSQTIDVVETLRDLIRIPSVNPMGRDLSGPEFGEYAVTDYLQRLFSRLGTPCERHEVYPRRENILARVDGPDGPSGRLLMIEAHQDTVPVDGMTIPPWTPDLRDGRVYGRGACDVKGGLACWLAAFARLAAERPRGMPSVVLAATANEEFGQSGARAVADLWRSGQSRLLPRAPDEVVVAEPTLLQVVTAHKGLVRWRCHTAGRAAHSSRPEQGENAIYRMASVLRQFERYAREVLPGLGEHPRLGRGTLSVGLIVGGISVNAVPDACRIDIDRRLLPGEDPTTAQQHVIDYVAEQLRREGASDLSWLRHDEPFSASPGLADERNGGLAERLVQTTRSHGRACETIAVPYGTDAASYSQTGVPTVVFGPGDLAQAHTCDEWIAVEQLHAATEIIYQFLLRSGA